MGSDFAGYETYYYVIKCIRRTLCTPLAVINCTPQTFFN